MTRDPGPPASWKRGLLTVASTAMVGAVILAASGGARPFLVDPGRGVGLAVVLLYQAASTWFSGLLSRGVLHAREPVVFHGLLQAMLVTFLFVLPILDVRGVAVFGAGAGVRAAGVALTLAGAVLRTGPILQLGRRFSHFVALQAGHTLETRGFYARVRHPGYAGLLVLVLGLSLVFRSLAGLVLLVPFTALVLKRIRTEEAFLLEQFGAAYRDYMTRTRRLIPGLY